MSNKVIKSKGEAHHMTARTEVQVLMDSLTRLQERQARLTKSLAVSIRIEVEWQDAFKYGRTCQPYIVGQIRRPNTNTDTSQVINWRDDSEFYLRRSDGRKKAVTKQQLITILGQ